MGESLGLTSRRIIPPAASVNRNCPNAKSELIPGSITEFENLGKQLNIHGLNFSFAQQRENASIFCSFPVKTFFGSGVSLLLV